MAPDGWAVLCTDAHSWTLKQGYYVRFQLCCAIKKSYVPEFMVFNAMVII
jgi:hypothetical protein